MSNLYGMPIAELFNLKECACGKNHALDAEVVYGDDGALTDILKRVAPNGKTAFISLQRTFLSIGAGILGAISASGASPLNIVLNRRFDNTLENVGGLFALPDDVRAAVVCDTELIGVAEYFTAVRNIPLVIMPLSPDAENLLSPTVSVKIKNRAEKIYAENKRFIIIDGKKLSACGRDGVAAAFAGVASCIISLIDYRARGAVTDEVICKESYKLVRDCITGALGAIKSDSGISEFLLETRIKISAADAFTDGALFGGSGETAVAELLEACGKKRLSFSERRFYAAYKLIELYKDFFTLPHGNILGVPDYNARAESLAEMTGANEYALLQNILDYALTAEETDKKIAPVAAAFGEETAKLASLKDKLFNAYVKLGGDSDLLSVYTPEEIRRAVYHAPDTAGHFSVLTLMRDTGVLELLK